MDRPTVLHIIYCMVSAQQAKLSRVKAKKLSYRRHFLLKSISLILDFTIMLNSLWLCNHHTICIIYSIEGRLICPIADLRPRLAIGHINRPSMLYIICQVVVTLWLTIIERTVSFRCTAILQVDMPYIKPVRRISNLSAVYQTCPPYIKPVRPYLNPRGAEVRAIWHINRASVLHTIYQVLVTLRLTVYGENSPVSAAVRRRPFWRLICHIANLRTLLKLL